MMHTVWDPFIGYMFIAYIILSFAFVPFGVGYAMYWGVKRLKIKRRRFA